MIPVWNYKIHPMHDLDLTSLRLFIRVCEARSMARVAEQEHIVGSAISKRMALLEERMGTPLLVRHKRSVEPTPAGDALLAHARSMLTSAQRIDHDMASFAAGVRGQVRVLASASAMAESLAEDVADFLHQPAHRLIQIDLEERLSADVVKGVQQGVAALGICWDAAEMGALHACTYRHDHLAIVAHPAHPLARHRRLAFTETLDHEHVSLPVASAVQLMLHRAAAQVGRTVNHRVIVSNFEAAIRVVRANLAISVVPIEVVHHYGSNLGLKVMPLTDSWALRRFAICCRDPQALSAPAQMLRQHLSQVQAQRGIVEA